MVFYKIEVKRIINNEEKRENPRQERLTYKAQLFETGESLYQKSGQKGMAFAVTLSEKTVILCAVANSYEEAENLAKQYAEALPFETEGYRMKEITISMFESMLRTAWHNEYICSDDEILGRFAIGALNGKYRNIDFGEGILDTNISCEKAKDVANRILFRDTLGAEIDRIYALNKKVKCYGHPVHYLLQTDDRDIRNQVYKTLLSALYCNNRIKNKRYAFVRFDDESVFPGASLDALYRCSEGGAVVIRYGNSDEPESEFAKRGSDLIAAICEIAAKYKNRVLTILCLPQSAQKIKEEFSMHWGNTAFVELHEEVVFGEEACTYLKARAKREKIRTDKKLFEVLENDAKTYTAAELNHIFDEWYCKKLRNDIYPQYKMAEAVKSKIKSAKPSGNAYQRLESLIGLSEAKSVMKNALNYFKVQKLFADRGMISKRPSMHMIFTGNPGTAKTTVARLFAEIMKENGLLTNGDIYEVGRADLVGKYVGTTAPLVKTAFKRAKGGVLFIDEAYSLVDDKDGLFGDEAINTIVQEMENNRQDTIVIFAGYPDKMERFLKKNPGLRSRIAFHIPFEDYSAKELCDIAQMIANETNCVLSDDAIVKMEGIFEETRKRSDFGNGRYARNLVEKAKMAQANRLMSMELDEISDKDLQTLCAEDIVLPTDKPHEKRMKIGFCA